MRLLSASRTGSKQNKTLRLFKQLEFIFRETDSLPLHLQRLPRDRDRVERREGLGKGNSNAFSLGRDLDLELKARKLLQALGAEKLAREIRVEWNPRLKTCAGRANFREKLISLNRLLRDHRQVHAENQFVAGQLDCLKQSSLTSTGHGVSRETGRHAAFDDEIDRTLRHELAHLLAQFRAGRRRISPHGEEWRQACHDLGIGDEVRCHNLPFHAKTY